MWRGMPPIMARTWVVSCSTPNPRQEAQFRRWRGVVDAALEGSLPGVSALELGTAAHRRQQWDTALDHTLLSRPGVGTESAEMPFIGTDFGDKFDDALIMQPGMVLVFEPGIWDEGAAGYRSEDIVAVTDSGWVKLSGSTYEPFGFPI